VTDPAANLDALLDREAIRALQTRYALALDSKDWDLLRTCFTENAVADYGALAAVNEGREAIVERCLRALDGLDSSQHLLGNHWVEVDGDTARAGCYLHAQHHLVSPSGLNTFVVGGTYRDEIVRTAEGWRIARRTLEASWLDGNAGIFDEAAGRLAAASDAR
jgi:3-phenylpropionate/cinnamic acid dioxygenase small subunit